MQSFEKRSRSMFPVQSRRAFVGRLPLLLMVAVAAVGVAVGYFTETSQTEIPSGDTVDGLQQDSSHLTLAEQLQPVLQRFSLSTADAMDSIEAPTVAMDSTGRIFVAWATEIDSQTRQVMLATSTDAGKSFAEPVVVVTTGVHTAVSKMRGRTIERRLKTLPHLACVGDRVFLAWVAGGEARDSVRLQLAEAATDSLQFSEPVTVHTSLEARPSFTSLYAAEDGTVVCSWLDNRHHVQQPYAAVRRPGQSEFEPERMVYAGPENKGICPCCPTEAFVSGNDVGVAFRGNEAGFRDMWVAHLPGVADQFAAPVPVVNPTWEFGGCPHDGPSVSQTSQGLHMAWMDAHSGPERVYVKTIGSPREPLCMADPGVQAVGQAHPMLRAFGDVLYLVWDQSMAPESSGEAEFAAQTHAPAQQAPSDQHEAHRQHGESGGGAAGRSVWMAVSRDGGQTFQNAEPVAQAVGVFQTRPQICIAANGQIVLAWMELSATGKQVVIATYPESTASSAVLVAATGDLHE